MSQQRLSCPLSQCNVSGTLKTVLYHIRKTHENPDLPVEFVTQWKLRQCQFCLKWFAKLGQHLSQNRKTSNSVKENINTDLVVSTPSCENLSPSTRNETSSAGDAKLRDPKDSAWEFISSVSINKNCQSPSS